jgi:hypothetical protein
VNLQYLFLDDHVVDDSIEIIRELKKHDINVIPNPTDRQPKTVAMMRMVGVRVRLHLLTQAALNGRVGTVQCVDFEKERLCVELDLVDAEQPPHEVSVSQDDQRGEGGNLSTAHAEPVAEQHCQVGAARAVQCTNSELAHRLLERQIVSQ